MQLLLTNCTYISWDTLEFHNGHILVDHGQGGGILLLDEPPQPPGNKKYKVLDCKGKLVTKSFAIGHHHVYSALARGMPPPARQPANFREILRYIWWTLDKSLDKDTIYYSALVTAMAAAKSGSTFIIDHHASPNHIRGSLELIASAFREVGVGHLLCYEVTDRDGKKKALEGLDECDSWLSANQGLVGLHASFTVGHETMQKAVELMHAHQSGIHMHLAEDKYDQEHCLQTYYHRVGLRLNEAGVLDTPRTILVHGIHLDNIERKLICSKPCWVAQNAESNLKNRVGVFSNKFLGDRIMTGTDGMHGDMLRSAKAVFLAGQHADQITHADTYRRFRNVHQYLRSNNFKGDEDNNLVVIDYDSPTEVNADNFTAHFVFGLSAEHITHVISQGKLIIKDRVFQTIDQHSVLEESSKHAKRLWSKMQAR